MCFSQDSSEKQSQQDVCTNTYIYIQREYVKFILRSGYVQLWRLVSPKSDRLGQQVEDPGKVWVQKQSVSRIPSSSGKVSFLVC